MSTNSDEDAFKAYHEGFRAQATKWPINPLDTIIKYIKSRFDFLMIRLPNQIIFLFN